MEAHRLLLEPCNLPANLVLVFEIECELFSKWLCNRLLNEGVKKFAEEGKDVVIFEGPRGALPPSGETVSFTIRWGTFDLASKVGGGTSQPAFKVDWPFVRLEDETRVSLKASKSDLPGETTSTTEQGSAAPSEETAPEENTEAGSLSDPDNEDGASGAASDPATSEGRSEPPASSAPIQVEISPSALTDCLAMMRPFALKGAGLQGCQIEIASGEARASSRDAMRIVTSPELKNVDLRIARDDASDLVAMLRHFGSNTRLRVEGNTQEFSDGRSRCVVSRLQFELPDPKHILDQPCTDVAIVQTREFVLSVAKITSQLGQNDTPVRFTLRGQEQGELCFSVPVNGGEAKVTCQVRRQRTDESAERYPDYDVTVDRQNLMLIEDARADQLELRILPLFLRFTEQRDGMTAQTLFHAAAHTSPDPPSLEQ